MATPDATPHTMFDTILERQKEAALDEVRQRAAEHHRVANLVLGANHNRTRRVDTVINIEGDYLVKVVDGDKTQWTFVVDGKTTMWYYQRHEDALLHMIAARFDPNPNTNTQAAYYAGRVLGIPNDDSDD